MSKKILKLIKLTISLTAGCCLLFILSCGFQQHATGTSGTGSETVIGKVVHEDGTPAYKTVITLYPHDFNPVTDTDLFTGTDTTDSEGNYTITLPSSDIEMYTLQAINTSQGTGTVISGIILSTQSDSTFVDLALLYKTGSIKAIISDSSFTENGYIFIPGTNYLSYVENGFAIIDSVPAGIIKQVFYQRVESSAPQSLSENIGVEPEITTIIESSGLTFARKILLNTTSAGADVAGNVTNFPVLIRLRASNFDFSQAEGDGSDVHFSKADGTPFPCEIERWDTVNQEAEIWVKVDTVYGNNSTQFILLYWGNPNISFSSNSSDVFDTAAGYQGVWHLNDNGETILDATTNHFDGVRQGDQTRIDGNIGFGQFFDGSGDYTDLGDVCNPDTSSLTVCAWIKKSDVNKIQTIVSKSKGSLPNPLYGWLFQLGEDGVLSIFMATDSCAWGDTGSFVLSSNIKILDSEWHHVATVINRSDRNECRVFIDGSDVSALPTGGDIKFLGKIVNSFPLRFGSNANTESHWDGLMDECSIIFRTCSQDFIKLSYKNQKNDDNLIFFQ